MSHQVSPFAALTGAEQQLKWLEYQSIRLPYTQAMPEPEEMTEAPPSAAANRAPEMPRAAQPPQPAPTAPAEREAFQRTRHSQYDAVIARMKRAQQQAKTYQNAP